MSYGTAPYGAAPYGGWAQQGSPPGSLSNTLLNPSGVAQSGVRVEVRLMPHGGFRSASATEVARLIKAVSGADGLWTVNVEANANITPAGTWYEVTEFNPTTKERHFWRVQASGAGQTLFGALI